jgi:SOS-response transcriptional repressor LexA
MSPNRYIYQFGKLLYYWHTLKAEALPPNEMRNIWEIRRDNFRLLLETVFPKKRSVTAKLLGFGQESLISSYLGPKHIGPKVARDIEFAAKKPPNWLDSDHRPPEQYPSSQDVARKPYNRLAMSRQVPVINWTVATRWIGLGGEDRMAAVEEWLPCGGEASEDTFALRVRGISMEPRFREGEIIFVDPNVQPSHGKFVVVHPYGQPEAILRQLIIEGDRQVLKALNSDWPEPVIEIDERTTLCGTVIFKGEQL